MLLIADTSPLISLMVLNKISLLEKLFGKYCVPQPVWDQLLDHRELIKYISSLETLSIHNAKFQFKYSHLASFKEEREAILFYKEIQADFLLTDDKRVRLIADLENIRCVGSIGILYLAWKERLIKKLKPEFNKLIENNRFYSKEIFNYFLQKTGEEQFK